MRKTALMLAGCAVLLSSCGGDKEVAAPTGQVVATVDGEEVTVAELRQEMTDLGTEAGGNLPQDAALRAIIARKQLAGYARQMKLDLLPETALREAKAKDLVLLQALTDKIRKDMPAISREEAQQYIDTHPASFVQRRIFIVDQIVIMQQSEQLVREIEPLQTLAQIEALLRKRNVKYNKTIGAIDAVTIDADAAEQLASLSPDEVFVLPDGLNMRANAVREVVIEPLNGEEATKIAMETLKTRRAQQTVSRKIEELVKAGESKVRYNPKFEPRLDISKGGRAVPPPKPLVNE